MLSELGLLLGLGYAKNKMTSFVVKFGKER